MPVGLRLRLTRPCVPVLKSTATTFTGSQTFSGSEISCAVNGVMNSLSQGIMTLTATGIYSPSTKSWWSNAYTQTHYPGGDGAGSVTATLIHTASPDIKQIQAIATKPMVSGGLTHSVAVKSDGTVIAWGSNSNGEQGDGTTTDRTTPVAVLGLTGVVAVAAGHYHTVALKSDGTVMAWGENIDGQLGDGTNTNRTSPVAVSGLTGVVAVTAGFYHTVALKSDGTVVAWGVNSQGGGGQLGD